MTSHVILRTDWPYCQPYHLLLNIAVGGWGGDYGVDADAFPACMEIDWVRVFRQTRAR